MSTRDDSRADRSRSAQDRPADPPPRRRDEVDQHAAVEQDRGPAHDDDGRDTAATTEAPKTSVAAAFALGLGVAGFALVLTVVLSPIGALFALIGVILGVVGIRAGGRPSRTGKGVAITGLVFSVLALLLLVAAAIGLTTFFSDPSAVNQVQQQLQQLTG